MIAIFVPLLWVAWLVVTEWVPMFPLNDLESASVKDRAIAAMINYPVGLLVAAGVALHQPWSLIGAAVLSALTIVGNVVNWWLPYFGLIEFPAMRAAYRREYSRTLKIVPTEGHAVVPDVQHMIVGVLCVLMLVTTLAA